jgi:hypothetical protein
MKLKSRREKMGRVKKITVQQIGEIPPTAAPEQTSVPEQKFDDSNNKQTSVPEQKFDICFAFDTTGSMSGCISQVKQNIQKIVKDLFKGVPNVRISLVAFEDYNFSYIWKAIDFTNDEGALIHFMTHLNDAHCIKGRDIGFTGVSGEGMEECYEYVLHKIPSLNWSSESMRSLIMIGDAPPHTPSHAYQNLDWNVELGKVRDKGINIYSVHCLSWGNEPKVKHFFKTIAKETNGYHLYLDQFTMIPAMMMAICYKQMGSERLEIYQNELKVSSAGVTHGMRQVFDIMLGRKTTEQIEEENEARFDYSRSSGSSVNIITNTSRGRVGKKATSTGLENLAETDFVLKPSPPSRFQVLDVSNDEDIMTFSANNGLTFQRGKGFYHFTKPELIQKNKEIVLREKSTGDFFEGNMCRKMLNLITYDETKRIKPTDFPQYDIFIQSTSLNRKLMGGSQFLYDTMA